MLVRHRGEQQCGAPPPPRPVPCPVLRLHRRLCLPNFLAALPTCLPCLPACRDCLCPVGLTRGGDQLPVSTKFDMRSDPQVIRNYGGWEGGSCGWVGK